jgi:hypothetical protein
MSLPSTLAAFILAGLALAAAPANAGDSDIVEVPLDVDIYDKPADESTKRPQFLKGGTQVLLMQKNSDDWCQAGLSGTKCKSSSTGREGKMENCEGVVDANDH